MPTAAPLTSSAPLAFHLLAKPIGAICNLDCRYCFYLDKEALYPATRTWRMSPDILESYIRQYIHAQDVPDIAFAWQGGEPTLLGIDFFRHAVALQQKYAGGRTITNAIQTNGTLLDDDWGRFLRESRFLVGISIDGPEDVHDAYRRDKRGQGTFRSVMAGLRTLQRHAVDFNTLTVVHDRNAREPERTYRFLRDIGSRHLQFIPLVERTQPTVPLHISGREVLIPSGEAGGKVTPWSVRPDDYGQFLCAIFDCWVTRDVGEVFVQQFDVALARWLGLPSPICVFAETCGRALAIEHNGDVYACDHYVDPTHHLGNLTTTPLRDLVTSPPQHRFGQDKSATLPPFCRRCDVRFACNGECPKHRFTTTPDGDPGLSYLCAAYKRFFHHIDRPMRTMAALLRNGRPPSDIMELAPLRPSHRAASPTSPATAQPRTASPRPHTPRAARPPSPASPGSGHAAPSDPPGC